MEKKGELRNVRLRNEKLINRQPLFWCKNILIPETTVADPLCIYPSAQKICFGSERIKTEKS